MSTLNMYTPYGNKSSASRLKGIAAVVALHAVVFYVLVSGAGRKGLEIIKKPLEAVVIQEVILPPPPPPPVPKVEQVPQQTPKLDAPPPPFVPPAEVAAPPTNAPVIAATQAPPPSPVQTIAPPPPALPDNSKAVIASIETEYQIKARATLNAAKRYPTGRQASQQRPEGKVKVWFTLARSGSLIDTGILESSNTNLLDDAALATVRRSVFPPFPSNTWAGEDQHKFVVELEFSPPSS